MVFLRVELHFEFRRYFTNIFGRYKTVQQMLY